MKTKEIKRVNIILSRKERRNTYFSVSNFADKCSKGVYKQGKVGVSGRNTLKFLSFIGGKVSVWKSQRVRLLTCSSFLTASSSCVEELKVS